MSEFMWDERGACNGPRDCAGTARGCIACDPRPPPPNSEQTDAAIMAAHKAAGEMAYAGQQYAAYSNEQQDYGRYLNPYVKKQDAFSAALRAIATTAEAEGYLRGRGTT